MEIVRTIKLNMSQKEKEAFDTVMGSLEEFCNVMRSLHELDAEEDFLFECASKALSFLDDLRVSNFT